MSKLRIAPRCAQCKKLLSDRRMIMLVKERRKSGIFTGRNLVLCHPCARAYNRMELKEIPDRAATYLRKFGIKALEVQLTLEDRYNKLK